ncbi:hypothetical protein M9H77_09159 [Catharanthus roseus]|uniref:Uncharacterized protein n=1 Tax=Catharanthus roseus TaxID=4058 RepID=A0ACC0C062_CATRO|nr:hypothetical protein M9H77_09159 [Catharanthus roseus]
MNLLTITDQIKKKPVVKNRSKQQLDITTVKPFMSRIWTPTVEDERAPRVRSEHPQRLTVRCVLPVKNGKNPSVAGGLKETLSLSQQEAPFPLHCGLTHGNPRVSRHR